MNSALISKINEYITDNNNALITGPVLNQVLRDMVNQSVAVVPYTTLMTMLGNKQIVPGMVYKIADRGDRGIFVLGLTSGTVSREGIRVMLCPKTYKTETLDGNSWKGIWHSSKTASIGDLFIAGGRVWKNKTGSIGTEVPDSELDPVNWEPISKSSFSSNEYIEMSFSVSYDIENDWIEEQSNGQNIVVGITYALKVMFDFRVNPADVTDWNLGMACRYFRNIKAPFGVANNVVDPTGGIAEVTATGIFGNKVGLIQNVVCSPSHNGGSDADVLAALNNCECRLIVSTNRIGGIDNIPNTVDQFTYHTDDFGFYLQWDFRDWEEGDGPVEDGNSVFRNCLLNTDVALVEMNVIGVDLSGTGAPEIKIGIETDDESYVGFTSLSALNNGIRVADFGNKTTERHRRFKISVTGGDVTGGILKISGKYL